MWCIRVNDDGSFRSASRRIAERGVRVCFTLPQWRLVDEQAAAQFVVPDDASRSVQLAFLRACGL